MELNRETKRFVTLVIGDNQDELMEKYSKKKKVAPYVKYKYLEAEKYLKKMKAALSQIAEDPKKCMLSESQAEMIKERITALSKMTPFEYYRSLTEGMYYDSDGNALCDDNPNGKWTTCNVGKNFSIPFTLTSGQEAYEAKKGDVDWDKMHLANTGPYYRAWEMVVDGDDPDNEDEEQIYNAMKDKQNYFSNFQDKDEYVAYSTSFWAYAIVDDDGWKDADSECGGDMMKWVSTFYDNYIEKMDENVTLTIYECVA